jgi:hypothetical protein
MLHAADDIGYARDNIFINFSTNSNGAIQCNGTAEGANPSVDNTFISLDSGNGMAAPVLGTAATAHWSFTNGKHQSVRMANVGSAETDALDWYKEGTFVPTIAFGGDDVDVTYGTQLGQYTRIGNRVFFDIYIALTSKGSSTGALGIFTLPYTSANNGIFTAVSLRVGGLAAAVTTDVSGYIQPNTSGVLLNKFAAGAVTDLSDTDVEDTSSFVITGSYQAK